MAYPRSGFAVRASSVTHCYCGRFGPVLHACCDEPRYIGLWDRSRTGSVNSHRIEDVRMPPNLLSERLISIDRYHSMSSIFKRFSPSLILFSASGGVMVRAIDEDTNAGTVPR